MVGGRNIYVDPELRNDFSFLMLVDASPTGPHRLELVPVRIHVAQVRRAPPRDADLVCERKQSLSREFGLSLDRTSDGLEISLAPSEEVGGRRLVLPRVKV